MSDVTQSFAATATHYFISFIDKKRAASLAVIRGQVTAIQRYTPTYRQYTIFKIPKNEIENEQHDDCANADKNLVGGTLTCSHFFTDV